MTECLRRPAKKKAYQTRFTVHVASEREPLWILEVVSQLCILIDYKTNYNLYLSPHSTSVNICRLAVCVWRLCVTRCCWSDVNPAAAEKIGKRHEIGWLKKERKKNSRDLWSTLEKLVITVDAIPVVDMIDTHSIQNNYLSRATFWRLCKRLNESRRLQSAAQIVNRGKRQSQQRQTSACIWAIEL